MFTVPVIDTLVPVPSLTSLRLINLPIPSSIPAGLRGHFEAPNLIIPVEKANPVSTLGNDYTAQLSPTISTVFAFDVGPELQDMMCSLIFYMPPAFPFADLAPVKIRSPGGITVFRLSNGVFTVKNNLSITSSSTLVGSAPLIQFANQYNVGSMLCDVGHRVAYQIDSVDGLNMDFFQMISPALGLFMIAS